MRKRITSRGQAKRRGSRSRLGGSYEVAAPGRKVSLEPVVGFWRSKGAKVPSFLLLLVLIWLINWLFISADFYVYEAKVLGNMAVSVAEIYQISGLDEISIFYVDPAQVEAAVTQLPEIKEAEVSHRLPNLVTIQVVERQPQFIWQTGQTRYWIDAEGIILTARGELPGAILVQDLDARPLRLGDRIDPQVLKAVQGLRSVLPEVATFQYSHHEGLSFHTEQSWPVYLGMEENPQAQVAILRALMRGIEAKGVQPQFIDLRFKGRPYYR